MTFDIQHDRFPPHLGCLLEVCDELRAYDRGIRILEEQVEMRPLSASLWHALGTIYKDAGKYEESAGALRSAGKLISIDYLFHLRLGHVLCCGGQYQDAIDAYNVAIRRASHKSIIWALIEFTEVNEQSLGSPIGDRICIDENLSKKFLWHWLGRAHCAVDNKEGAMEIYRTAIDKYKAALTHSINRNGLLWTYCALCVHSNWGLDVFTDKQSLPKRIIWCALGMAYECLGNNKFALKAYEKALAFDPDNLWLRTTLSKLGNNIISEGGIEKDSVIWLDIERSEPYSKEAEERPIRRYFKAFQSGVQIPNNI